MPKKITTEDFIKKANLIHKNKYEYNKTIYTQSKDKVIITCLEHGDFEQQANSHLNGSGCKKCAINFRAKLCTSNTIDFINKANLIHNKYDYSKVDYINNSTKICIICLKHGEFWQTPDSHLQGKGCPKCKSEKLHNLFKFTLNDFINRSNLIHNNFYSYPEQDFINQRTKVKIICPEHGEFEQLPVNHLKGVGCPSCSFSKGENYISNLLNTYNIPYKTQYKLKLHKIGKNTNIIYVDFYIEYNEKQYIIEYDGIQHFEFIPYFHKTIEKFKKQQRRDKILIEYCELNSINLINIPYTFSQEEIIEIIQNKCKNDTK